MGFGSRARTYPDCLSDTRALNIRELSHLQSSTRHVDVSIKVSKQLNYWDDNDDIRMDFCRLKSMLSKY